MVACLIASGALAGAVTDPNGQDPTGKTPASIAAINGHTGLAGYLSESALTSHLSSLTLQESELSKELAVLEADHTVSCISDNHIHTCDDQLSLNDTLAAVRNSAIAAARIQAAYRAHSFRKRQQNKSFNAISIEDYGFSSDDIQGISVVSKLAFRNKQDHNSAALSIQKKYRGYKGRKDFNDIRRKVVKIQVICFFTFNRILEVLELQDSVLSSCKQPWNSWQALFFDTFVSVTKRKLCHI